MQRFLVIFVKAIVFVATMNLLTSCANNSKLTKEVTESTEYIPSIKMATITGSITAYGSDMGWITLKSTATGDTQTIGVINRNDEYSWKGRTGAGRTYLLELIPGSYEIIDWKFKVFVLGGTKVFSPQNMQPIALDLKQGDQLYLGDFNFELIYGKNIFGINIPADLNIQIRNKRDRDLNNLKKKFPNLNLNNFNTSLIKYQL